MASGTVDQGQVVPVIHFADGAQPLQGFLVAQMAGQGIAGVGGKGDHRPIAQHLGRTGQIARLGVFIIDDE